MEWIDPLLAVLAGVALRLAFPTSVTALAVYFLRKLDACWQAEGEIPPLKVEKPQCWKIKGCTPEQRKACKAATSPLPCWQVFRLPNGYLREECLACEVFREAPAPAHA